MFEDSIQTVKTKFFLFFSIAVVWTEINFSVMAFGSFFTVHAGFYVVPTMNFLARSSSTSHDHPCLPTPIIKKKRALDVAVIGTPNVGKNNETIVTKDDLDPEEAKTRSQHILFVQDATATGDCVHHRVLHFLLLFPHSLLIGLQQRDIAYKLQPKIGEGSQDGEVLQIVVNISSERTTGKADYRKNGGSRVIEIEK
ncbi:unnamed protein product, partial [Mesorhabditis belari]|uniref:Uncharacterized protein n=1 Tax=Mesorhabditis belari TaxID=2138241 RepID=A0AAF3EGB1_9BILA